jgi:hypothetical protein
MLLAGGIVFIKSGEVLTRPRARVRQVDPSQICPVDAAHPTGGCPTDCGEQVQPTDSQPPIN